MKDYDSLRALDKALDIASGKDDGFIAFLIVLCVIGSVIAIICIISLWKIFKKAGKNGWEAIIPVYNMITFTEIVGKPIWYFLLFFVPFAPIVLYMELAQRFGKDASFGILMYFFPFVCLPMLAFGKDTYQAAPAAANAPVQNVTENVAPASSPVATVTEQPTAPAPVAPAPEQPVAPAVEQPTAPAPVAPVTPVQPTAPAPAAPAPEQPVAPAPAPEAPAAPMGPAQPTQQ